jgi:outer membrane lipoprotein LolB
MVALKYTIFCYYDHIPHLKDRPLRIAIIFVLLLLSGCAVSPPQAPGVKKTPQEVEERWKANEQKLAALSHWQAQGRLAAARGPKGGNASFQWEQHGEFYEIKLWGPFGAGAVYLIGGPNRVQAKESNGKITTAATPEELMQKIIGWQVPITGLRYCMIGLPEPTVKIKGRTLTSEGNLLLLLQNGWQVHYDTYADNHSVMLPNKLHLKSGDLTVKLVVTSWERK